MKIIETTFERLPRERLEIGFEGENQRATVRIDCASVFAEYPNATPALIVKPLFADAYPVVVDRNGTDVDWLITSEILSFTGDGEIQLVFYKGEVICKSAVSKIRVSRSLTVTGEKPDPIARWEDAANQKLAEVDAVIVSIDEMDAVAHGLPEGSAPTAEVQDIDDHKRIVLGIPAGATGATGAKGDKGDRGEQGLQGIQGERGLQGIQGVKGDRGEKGDTGATGATPDLSIGTVSTLPAGSSATAEITGTAENPVLSLGIPQGAQGIQGEKGDKGDPGEGVPTGGLTDQVLAKASDTDRDTKWMYVAPVIKNTASGAIASFSDGADGHPIDELKVGIEPVQDLHGYDHPWPAGGGVNKWPVSDMSFTLFSTSLSKIDYPEIYAAMEKLTPGAIYRCGSTGTGENVLTAINLYYSDRTIAIRPSNMTGGDIPDLSDGTITLNVVQMQVGTATNVGKECHEIRVIETTTSNPAYVPYSNICPITGWDGVKVTRTGANVWDEDWESGFFSYSGVKSNSSTAIRSKNFCVCAPGTRYYAFCGNATSALYVLWYDAEQNFIVRQNAKNTLVESPGNAHYFKLSTDPNYQETYGHDISLNYPATDTEYHPGTVQTVDITLPTEAGTVYGGTLDVSTGELVVDRAEVDMGTLAWSSTNTDTAGKNRFMADVPGLKIGDYRKIILICSEYKEIGSTVIYGSLGITPHGTIARVLVADPVRAEMTGAQFKAAMNGVQLVYPLAEPITYILTPTEIRTLLGTNNVWSDAGDVSVKYNADTKLYIDGKIAELVAQIVNS